MGVERELESRVHKAGQAQELLDAFCQYQAARNPGTDSGDRAHWDHAVLLTGYDLYHTTSSVAGVAPVARMCDAAFSCSLVEGRHLGRSFVLAHEMGHNLGMVHDGVQNLCSRSCCLMSAVNGAGKTTWSPCSVRELSAYVLSLGCPPSLPSCRYSLLGVVQGAGGPAQLPVRRGRGAAGPEPRGGRPPAGPALHGGPAVRLLLGPRLPTGDTHRPRPLRHLPHPMVRQRRLHHLHSPPRPRRHLVRGPAGKYPPFNRPPPPPPLSPSCGPLVVQGWVMSALGRGRGAAGDRRVVERLGGGAIHALLRLLHQGLPPPSHTGPILRQSLV